jgi:hypothetical protein
MSLRLAAVACVLLGLPFRLVIGYNVSTIFHRLSVADTSPTAPNH